jgi:hypothetical protein
VASRVEPQQVQVVGPGTIRLSRGICAGNGWRDGLRRVKARTAADAAAFSSIPKTGNRFSLARISLPALKKGVWRAGLREGHRGVGCRCCLSAARGMEEPGSALAGPTGFNLAGFTKGGWFIGGGDEYALGFFPGLFWKTEYRSSAFGRADTSINFAATPTGVSVSQKFKEHSVRTELVYRFNWAGPVVAKY